MTGTRFNALAACCRDHQSRNDARGRRRICSRCRHEPVVHRQETRCAHGRTASKWREAVTCMMSPSFTCVRSELSNDMLAKLLAHASADWFAQTSSDQLRATSIPSSKRAVSTHSEEGGKACAPARASDHVGMLANTARPCRNASDVPSPCSSL